jgi:16S rRNA (uracil1498-N3)-methyltransferase
MTDSLTHRETSVIRLFVKDGLEAGMAVTPSREQSHYLGHVMRVNVGDRLRLFNGRDGEWEARVETVGKRDVVLLAEMQTRPQTVGPDLDLLVALVKRTRMDVIAEKAAELGARRLRPVITERSIADRTNVERLTAIAIEAAEQCLRVELPQVMEPEKLDRALANLEVGRRLMFCDEAGDARPAVEALAESGGTSWALLIGPEGGFTPAERARIRAMPNAVPVSLGPRILRADTAAISALTLWQATLGDWRSGE